MTEPEIRANTSSTPGPPAVGMNRDVLLSMLAEGFHTAFRKATDCEQALPIWRLIRDMPGEEWERVIRFVGEPLADTLDEEGWRSDGSEH